MELFAVNFEYNISELAICSILANKFDFRLWPIHDNCA